MKLVTHFLNFIGSVKLEKYVMFLILIFCITNFFILRIALGLIFKLINTLVLAFELIFKLINTFIIFGLSSKWIKILIILGLVVFFILVY